MNDDTSTPMPDEKVRNAEEKSKLTMEEMMRRFGGNLGKLKPSNRKEQMRKDCRLMRKRMQYIARNPRGKDDTGGYLSSEDIIEVLQCNEALFVMMEHLLKI